MKLIDNRLVSTDAGEWIDAMKRVAREMHVLTGEPVVYEADDGHGRIVYLQPDVRLAVVQDFETVGKLPPWGEIDEKTGDHTVYEEVKAKPVWIMYRTARGARDLAGAKEIGHGKNPDDVARVCIYEIEREDKT